MGSTNSVLIQMFLIILFMLCVKSVTLESDSNVWMQNNTLVYNNPFCWTYNEL